MSNRSIFSRITRPFLGGKLTNFVELHYERDEEIDKSIIDDISKLAMKEVSAQSPDLQIKIDGAPKIPLIGIGGVGIRLLSKIVERIKKYGMTYPTMAIDCDSSDLNKYDNIEHKFLLPNNPDGTGHQYRIAVTSVETSKQELLEELTTYISNITSDYKHEMVFLILGSGGTGVGAGIEIARLLVDMGKRPVPFLILPSKEEMTRIKFNAAVALYYFSYAPKSRCLNLTTVCIDNERLLNKNSKKHYTNVISSANERISATIGDIIATTELESHSYSADLNEFLEIFRDLKGVGTLQYMQIEDPLRGLDENFSKNADDSTSLDVDIFKATRGFLFLSSKKGEITARDYRQLLLEFDNADIFNKLHEIDSDKQFFAIRGIFTGFSFPNYIEELMKLAEDSRISILSREVEQNQQGKVNPKIEKIAGSEQIDVKTEKEVSDSRSKRSNDLG